MDARISLRDMEIAWRAVDETKRQGRGGLERAAQVFGITRAVVMDAVDRVERSFGGQPFFVVRVRRTGEITPTGLSFHGGGQVFLAVWRSLDGNLRGLQHWRRRSGTEMII